ncbi:MAG: tetratricopeptide repeat protein [Candidatus Obscuribacter sp.]|nr:tetratricopeptide repeat protein [Candidatus Obscuribacter sp.]MBK7837094.1 tetratricopeptide repeat protein [Candidatus Obscuribacter sp.]MBK9620320.1 tetratricopeptide repeat protein [Candidatus Obscuribacter sp.]MBK9773484.1 tetratricopeptide repeat protein [Candidatus Obscuribacter sp.]
MSKTTVGTLIVLLALTGASKADAATKSGANKLSGSKAAAKQAFATTGGEWQREMSLAQELMAAQNLKTAESHYQKALTYVSAQDSANFAHTLQGLGLTKYYLDDFRAAATLFEKTQDVIDQAKITDIWMVELNYEMLSRAYRHLDQPNRSEIYALKALDFSAAKIGKQTRTYALCLRNIGILRHGQHRYIEAEEYFSQCLDILKKAPDTSKDVMEDLISLREENLASLDKLKSLSVGK